MILKKVYILIFFYDGLPKVIYWKPVLVNIPPMDDCISKDSEPLQGTWAKYSPYREMKSPLASEHKYTPNTMYLVSGYYMSRFGTWKLKKTAKKEFLLLVMIFL